MINQINSLVSGLFRANSKLDHLLFLAVSTTAFGVVAFTTGSGLFLTHVGPKFLPISYTLMGLISIPIYTWLSQVVDHTSKTKLARRLLILAVFFVLLLRVLITLDFSPIYYPIYIGFYFQWILVTEVIFPSLVSDYFTSMDWKNYTPYLRMAVAFGGLLGGLITSLLSQYISTENILLILPVFYLIVFFQLIFLENQEKPLDNNQDTAQINLRENISNLPRLLTEYPIIIYLASSTFLFIFLYTLAEFQYFNIYAQTFKNDAQLTGFLGIMRMINNLIPFLVLYLFTRPLINKFGLVRMNLIYPLTMLLSFIGLAVNFTLPMAVFANLNSDGFDDSINQPIHNLNYNAVPYHLVGRVRAISNGLFYSFGLATAGFFLWILQGFFTPFKITLLGIIFSVLFLFIRYLMGKSYLQSLFTMLKARSVKLDEVSEGLSNLPASYNKQVEDLLTSSDRHDQILGLELATLVSNSSIFIPQIEGLLFGKDELVRTALIKFLSHVSNPTINFYLTKQLNSENNLLQLISLEALIANKYALKSEQLRHLLRQTFIRTLDKIIDSKERPKKVNQIDSILLANNQLKALICLAISQSESNDSELNQACNLIWHSEIDSTTKLSVIRTIKRTGDRNLIPLVKQFITDNQSSTNVKIEGLDTLANLAIPKDNDLANIAIEEITNSDPLVRAAAFKLLGVIRDPNLLENVALGLENNNLAVRLWAASALANYGEKCLIIAEKYLYSSRMEVVEAAIAVIAKVRTRRAVKILENYLEPDYQLVNKTLYWLKQISADQYPWNLIKIILEDYQQKLVNRVLYVISRLDHKASFPNIQQLLQTQDIRLRANAIETLSSFKYRDFILPILPLLENNNTQLRENFTSDNLIFNSEKFLEDIINTSQSWLKVAAIFVLVQENKNIPLSLINNSDSLVKEVANYFTNSLIDSKKDVFISRIFFLKTIYLLEKLCLDELLLVNKFLEESQFLAGKTICNCDHLVNDLFIIYQGNAVIYQENQIKDLHTSQYFGEIALFDYAPLSVTIIAKTNCTILTLSRENFNHLLELCPRLLLCYSQSC